jgi:hypothetical protein
MRGGGVEGFGMEGGLGRSCFVFTVLVLSSPIRITPHEFPSRLPVYMLTQAGGTSNSDTGTDFSLTGVLAPLVQPPPLLLYYETIRFSEPGKLGQSGLKYILLSI